jgi:hypothetical protein
MKAAVHSLSNAEYASWGRNRIQPLMKATINILASHSNTYKYMSLNSTSRHHRAVSKQQREEWKSTYGDAPAATFST